MWYGRDILTMTIDIWRLLSLGKGAGAGAGAGGVVVTGPTCLLRFEIDADGMVSLGVSSGLGWVGLGWVRPSWARPSWHCAV